MKMTTSRLLLSCVFCLITVPTFAVAQGSSGDMFGIPWSGVDPVDLLDDSDVAHVAGSRADDFDRIGAEADRRCDALRRPPLGGDAHENALRSSDLILAHLRATTLNRFTLEDLISSRQVDMSNRLGAMTHGERAMRNSRLALDAMLPAGVAPLSLEPVQEDLPFDCQ